MQFLELVLELWMEWIIGWSKIPGEQSGATMATLKSKEGFLNQILNVEYLLLLRNVLSTRLTVLLPKLQQQQLPKLQPQQLPKLQPQQLPKLQQQQLPALIA